MKKIKTGRNILMGIVLLTSITLSTIVYSAYSTKLQISGEAILRRDAEIRVTNLKMKSTSGSPIETYNSKYGKDTTSMYVTLPAKSSIVYEVEITNKMNKLYDVTVKEESRNNSNIGVNIELKTGDLISKNSKKIFTITLTNNTTSQQVGTVVYQYVFTEYVNPTILSDTNNNGIADVGEIFTIGTERFYVISNDGTNVKALAEYNLLVGKSSNDSVATPLTNPTGKQDKTAIGWHFAEGTRNTEYPNLAVVSFASSAYWGSGGTIDLNNSKNTIYPYLVNYKTILENLEARVSDISLITKEELVSLGCSTTSRNCLSAPSWVYKTTYWTRSANDATYVWIVGSDADFVFYHECTFEHRRGVRPVITVPSVYVNK